MKKLDLDTIATIRNGLETLLAILDEEEKDLDEELASKYADFTHAQEE